MLNFWLATPVNSEQFTPWSQAIVVCEQLDSEQGVSPVTPCEHLVGRVQYQHWYLLPSDFFWGMNIWGTWSC